MYISVAIMVGGIIGFLTPLKYDPRADSVFVACFGFRPNFKYAYYNKSTAIKSYSLVWGLILLAIISWAFLELPAKYSDVYMVSSLYSANLLGILGSWIIYKNEVAKKGNERPIPPSKISFKRFYLRLTAFCFVIVLIYAAIFYSSGRYYRLLGVEAASKSDDKMAISYLNIAKEKGDKKAIELLRAYR